MTLREKIADWISGGVLSDNAKRLDETSSKMKQWASEAMCYRDHLLYITHLETPNMAHVGKKAVAIAKRGLGE
jgi:hypothetical protein